MNVCLQQEVSPRTSGRLSHSSGPLNGGSLSDSPPVSPSEIDENKVRIKRKGKLKGKKFLRNERVSVVGNWLVSSVPGSCRKSHRGFSGIWIRLEGTTCVRWDGYDVSVSFALFGQNTNTASLITMSRDTDKEIGERRHRETEREIGKTTLSAFAVTDEPLIAGRE